MSERLVTERELRDLLRELRVLKQRVAAIEVVERSEYLTGSFAPALVGSGTAGTFTYGAGNLVEWRRRGADLFVNGRVSITATTVAPVGNLTITGFPYAGVADANMAIAGVMAMIWRGVTFAANYQALTLQFANGTTVATIAKTGTAGVNVAPLTGAELGGGVYDFRFGGSYRIA